MKLKSYFAATVAGAIEQARGEMGAEAVIVQSRPAPPEAKHLGKYEVVVAQMPEGESGSPCTQETGRADPITKELERIHRQMEELRRLMWRYGAGNSRWRSSPILSSLNDRLTGAGLDAEMAGEIVACVEARLTGDPLLERGGEEPAPEGIGGEGGRAWTCLLAELENRIQVDPSLGKPGARPRVVALVGPPGAGKTTALVKLAVEAGLKSRRPIALLTTDTSRIGAAWQLQTFAGILGVGFQALDTPQALGQAIEEHRGKDLILIDTPGLGRAEIDEGRELAAALTRDRDVDIHLVLEATGNSADLLHAVDRFAIFGPSKLLLTKLDETVTPGSALTVAFRTGKPISYISTGQRIPEDLQVADREQLINRLLENCRMEVGAWLEMRPPRGYEAALAGGVGG